MITKDMSQSAEQASASLIRFLNTLDQLQEQFGALTVQDTKASGDKDNVHSFIGYPIWARVVYCSTLPTDTLLKNIENFTKQPSPEPAVLIIQALRELLNDRVFVVHAQSFPDRHARLSWLQAAQHKSLNSRSLVDFCGHLLL